MATNYKEWIARYDNNTKTKIQCWKKRIGTAESKLKVKTIKFKEELKNVRSQLGNQKSLFEQRMKSLES